MIITTKNFDELTVEEVQTLYAMGYDLIIENGHVMGVSREVNA